MILLRCCMPSSLSVTHEANGKVDLHMIWPTPVSLDTSAVPGPADDKYQGTRGYSYPSREALEPKMLAVHAIQGCVMTMSHGARVSMIPLFLHRHRRLR